ncbi:hypothetical protein HAX54_037855 [Datura stramonium]|uniref:Branched-chain-amino-acid aminotransferase n=1 Tax=Datura stramonium TaxID=4076 RepID=A0ABS8VKK1_DATST|nr:hypothetical protein [Datura stramonium]
MMIRGAACFRKFYQTSALSSKIAARNFTTQAAVQPAIYSSDEESADIDWDNLGFHLMQTDYMYVTKSSEDGIFTQGQLNRFGNIQLSPSAGVLNYGQNAIRMQFGAERMCMPSPSTDQFVDAVKQTALANKRWIPPSGKGSLYIRPLLIGSGPILGLAPHLSTLSSLCLPTLEIISRMQGEKFSDVLYLDAVNKKYIEEVSASNFFLVKGNVLSTPIAKGTILEGVTRKSIMEIALDLGYTVEERLVKLMN